HVVADIDPALNQLAADPERQRTFLAGADLAGQRAETLACRGRMGHEYRTRRIGRRRLATAGRQQSAEGERHQGAAPPGLTCAAPRQTTGSTAHGLTPLLGGI